MKCSVIQRRCHFSLLFFFSKCTWFGMMHICFTDYMIFIYFLFLFSCIKKTFSGAGSVVVETKQFSSRHECAIKTRVSQSRSAADLGSVCPKSYWPDWIWNLCVHYSECPHCKVRLSCSELRATEISGFQLVSPIIWHESKMRLDLIIKATDSKWSELKLIDLGVRRCSWQYFGCFALKWDFCCDDGLSKLPHCRHHFMVFHYILWNYRE